MVSAFFASLECCPYINLSTAKDDNDEPDEAKEHPLFLTKPILHDELRGVGLWSQFSQLVCHTFDYPSYSSNVTGNLKSRGCRVGVMICFLRI
ncbi:hypothetical protein MUK42_18558 [Musa troglodytarum]|uniref:Uncharacterized protein n=1 Tax=Musa troglodytarum TaxID=320322 RepID=A0A9E7JEY3_9LILI|nr:hypothetical protein MUK42_18558 [Musa troglodytarum]